LLAPLAATFAELPPSSSELTERKSVVPSSPPADRRREHRESAAVVLARTGSRAAVLRRSEPTRFLVGERRQSGRLPWRDPQRAAASNQSEEEHLHSLFLRAAARDFPTRAEAVLCSRGPWKLVASSLFAKRGTRLPARLAGAFRSSLLRSPASADRRSQRGSPLAEDFGWYRAPCP